MVCRFALYWFSPMARFTSARVNEPYCLHWYVSSSPVATVAAMSMPRCSLPWVP